MPKVAMIVLTNPNPTINQKPKVPSAQALRMRKKWVNAFGRGGVVLKVSNVEIEDIIRRPEFTTSCPTIRYLIG